jgi:hypothetical protein
MSDAEHRHDAAETCGSPNPWSILGIAAALAGVTLVSAVLLVRGFF